MRQSIWIMLMTVLAILHTPGLSLAETTAYIANSGADAVLRVIDSSDAVDTTAVGDTPYGISITPDGKTVLITQNDGDALVFIDTANFSELSETLQVGKSPRGIAVDPDGRYAYVANFEDDTVSQIDIPGHKVEATIAVAEGPTGLAVCYDADGDDPVVYVAAHQDDTVTVIGEDNQTSQIGVGDGPVGVAASPNGLRVYVANSNDDTVSIIDTRTDTVIDSVNVGDFPWGVAVGADGDYVYVTNTLADTVTVIQTSDNTIKKTFSVGDRPRGVAAPSNGTFAYVVNQGQGSIHRIDMDDESVTEYIAGQITGALSIGAFIGDTPPSAPSALTAKPIWSNAIRLRWVDNSTNELGFKIERRKANQTRYVQVATVGENETFYEDYHLSSGTLYYYRVRAYTEASDSAYSAPASARTASRYSASVTCFLDTLMN